jgi:hypothetical protein
VSPGFRTIASTAADAIGTDATTGRQTAATAAMIADLRITFLPPIGSSADQKFEPAENEEQPNM